MAYHTVPLCLATRRYRCARVALSVVGSRCDRRSAIAARVV